jgi:phage tail protein X
MAATYFTKDRDTVDSICHAYYGRTSGAVEQVLEANVGLADYGPELPAGVLIALPDIAEPSTQVVRLFD